jgi:hypothetical protein
VFVVVSSTVINRPAVPSDKLVDLADIAVMCDVVATTPPQWRQRRVLPEPDAYGKLLVVLDGKVVWTGSENEFTAKPLWWASTIVRWAKATGRPLASSVTTDPVVQ